MCDCEPAAVYVERYRKARKRRRCCECAGWIEAGDRYQYTSGISDHRGFSDATCIECAQVRYHYVDALPPYACWPCLGNLYDEFERKDWPAHLVAAQEALKSEGYAA